MAIIRITTPDGDRLRNTRTGKLAGRPPRKPRIPKVSPTSSASLTEAVSGEPDSVEKNYDKFITNNARGLQTQDASKFTEEQIESLFDLVVRDSIVAYHFLALIPKGSKLSNCVKAGWIQWHKYEGEEGRITHVEVAPEYRRKGLATFLYKYACQISEETGIIPPRHHEVRTREGDAWAISLGEPLPLLACGNCGEGGHYESDCASGE